MKFSVAIVALAAVASAQFVKVPRQEKSTVLVQGAAMTTKDGTVVAFDSENVYKAASE
ncbi:hypothetical protein F4808DRAFT_331827 [Astrocystis sublimbata]|nr:hypothetical protein F4808DRAFT_331827 [Astrocystis sublimbata]